MNDDIFVINAVVHTFNFAPSNAQDNRFARAMLDYYTGGYAAHQASLHGLQIDDLLTDWSVEAQARTLFLETDIDIAVHHTLPLFSWFKDGLTPHSKTIEALERYPDRFIGYVAVDPTQGIEVAIREMDLQLDQTPNAVGLKLYPAQVDPVRSWRLDDPKIAFPLFERARERGIKVIAVHKAMPLGPIPLNPFRIDDVEGAATEFPDLNFEIVHAGWAFVHETALALARYPNVFGNLESTSFLILRAPQQFEKILAELAMWGGIPKLVYGDGGSLGFHSQLILQACMAFQFRDETCEEYGIQKLTQEDRAMIFGGNYARMVGLDIEAAKARIADDEFALTRRETGIQPAYSNWKRELHAEVAVT